MVADFNLMTRKSGMHRYGLDVPPGATGRLVRRVALVGLSASALTAAGFHGHAQATGRVGRSTGPRRGLIGARRALFFKSRALGAALTGAAQFANSPLLGAGAVDRNRCRIAPISYRSPELDALADKPTSGTRRSMHWQTSRPVAPGRIHRAATVREWYQRRSIPPGPIAKSGSPHRVAAHCSTAGHPIVPNGMVAESPAATESFLHPMRRNEWVSPRDVTCGRDARTPRRRAACL